MALRGLGNLARLPREIRDQIYQDYFAVNKGNVLEPYAKDTNLVLSVYMSQPNINILSVSRDLYQETHSVCIPEQRWAT